MGWGSFTKSFTKPFKKAVSIAKDTLTAPTDLAKQAIGMAAGALSGGQSAGSTGVNVSSNTTPTTNLTVGTGNAAPPADNSQALIFDSKAKLEIAKLEANTAEKDRKLIDGAIDQGRNLIIFATITGGLIYLYKNQKPKRRK